MIGLQDCTKIWNEIAEPFALMIHWAFKLDETISNLLMWKKSLRNPKKEEDQWDGNWKSVFFQSENGTKPPAESQLT